MPKTVTNKKTVFNLSRTNIDILEFGEELFHKESPVLMPSLTGKGDEKKMPGVKALGAVYKQYEFDSRKRVIVASHTDTDGSVQANFSLANLRAKNVLWLLTGDRRYWSRLCFEYHKISDYKRILKYFHLRRGWKCDPGSTDDSWDDKTLRASRTFFGQYSTSHKPGLSPGLHGEVKKHSEHRWPVAAWEAVYDLYMEEICAALHIPVTEIAALRIKQMKFADIVNKSVNCGASFPLTEAKSKNNYNDKKGRRVEVLFFYTDEAPGVRKGSPEFKCPAGGTEKHTSKVCPIYYGKHFKATYLDPDKILKSVAYHLKFTYYNQIKEAWCNVPAGLPIKAYYYKAVGGVPRKNPIESSVSWHDGVYTVMVEDDSSRTNIQFEFKTVAPDNANNFVQWWLFTGAKDQEPELQRGEFVAVRNIREIGRRLRYYDLPKEWCSENYWTRYDNNMDTGGRYRDVIKDKLKLKPYGSQKSSESKPMIFSFDDIVLLDASGNQNINDAANGPKDKDEANAKIALSDDSRVSLFHIKAKELVLYKPFDANTPYFSNIKFKENLITDVPPDTRMVIFANDFYSVFDRRAGQPGEQFDRTKKHVKGCRAARLGDDNNHVGISVNGDGVMAAPLLYHAGNTGNFELHYIHRGCPIEAVDTLTERAFLIIYWNGKFISAHDGASSDTHHVSAGDVTNYATKGLINAKKRWELKGYTIEPQTLGAGDAGKVQIKPVYLFEAKKPGFGGKPKCVVTITNDTGAGAMSPTTSSMYYPDYKIRDYLGVGTHTDVDGLRFKTLVVSHELGHALGLDDEYTYDNGDISAFYQNADDGKYSQYYLGMPYQIEKGSMMITNRAPRMRHLWMFVNRLNEATVDPVPNELRGLLGGAQYKIVHRWTKRGRTKKLEYFMAKQPDDFRPLYAPFQSERRKSVPTGELDLALYRLGDDETARSLKIGGRRKSFPFDGILVVFLKVNMVFYNGTGANDVWNDPGNPTINYWWNDLLAELRHAGKFYLHVNKNDAKFRNVYMFFYPYLLGGNVANKEHYKVEVELNRTRTVDRSGAPAVIGVGNKSSRRWVANYMLGKDHGGTKASVPRKLRVADLEHIRLWFCDQIGLTTATDKAKCKIKTS